MDDPSGAGTKRSGSMAIGLRVVRRAVPEGSPSYSEQDGSPLRLPREQHQCLPESARMQRLCQRSRFTGKRR